MDITLSQASRSADTGALKLHRAFNSLTVDYLRVDYTRSNNAPSSVYWSDKTWPSASPKSHNKAQGIVSSVEFANHEFHNRLILLC
jgi:hypothetical protein